MSGNRNKYGGLFSLFNKWGKESKGSTPVATKSDVIDAIPVNEDAIPVSGAEAGQNVMFAEPVETTVTEVAVAVPENKNQPAEYAVEAQIIDTPGLASIGEVKPVIAAILAGLPSSEDRRDFKQFLNDSVGDNPGVVNNPRFQKLLTKTGINVNKDVHIREIQAFLQENPVETVQRGPRPS